MMFARSQISRLSSQSFALNSFKRKFSTIKPLLNKEFHGNPTELPNSFGKRIALLSIISAAGVCIYLDQHMEIFETLFKKDKEASDDKVAKRKIAKLNVLKHENIIPKKINFVFCEDLPADANKEKLYVVDILKMLNYYVNEDVDGRYSKFIKDFMKAQKIDTLELLAKRTPPGFLSFLINKYITTNISGDFNGAPVKSENLYITNAQLMNLDEIFKFEIDYSNVNRLILNKSNESLNEDMMEYFGTVNKVTYV